MQIHPIGLQQDAGSDSEEATTVNDAKYETEIRKASSSELAEAQRRVFSDFLSKL